MFSKQMTTRRRIRGAVKATRKTLNRALDAAEPRLEAAAEDLQDLGRDAAKVVRAKSREGLKEIRSGYGKIERQVRGKLSPSKKTGPGAKAALVAAGVAAIAVALFR
jgi:hypothetical protein